VASCATGYSESDRGFSSQICVTEAIVGEGNWIDALPFAVHPEATNNEDAFSANYSTEQIKNGGNRVFRSIEAAKENGDLLSLDRNRDPLFPGEEKLKEILSSTYNFRLVQELCRRNPGLRLFRDRCCHSSTCTVGHLRGLPPVYQN
jgi:hypothetical protein